jgi:hypothetical protein
LNEVVRSAPTPTTAARQHVDHIGSVTVCARAADRLHPSASDERPNPGLVLVCGLNFKIIDAATEELLRQLSLDPGSPWTRMQVQS